MKGKGCLIAVIVIIVIVLIIAAVLYLNKDKLLGMAVDKMVDQIMANLPPDYDEVMARQTIDAFIAAVKEGRVNKEEFQKIGEILQATMADQKLETHEADQLMEAMQEAAR